MSQTGSSSNHVAVDWDQVDRLFSKCFHEVRSAHLAGAKHASASRSPLLFGVCRGFARIEGSVVLCGELERSHRIERPQAKPRFMGEAIVTLTHACPTGATLTAAAAAAAFLNIEANVSGRGRRCFKEALSKALALLASQPGFAAHAEADAIHEAIGSPLEAAEASERGTRRL